MLSKQYFKRHFLLHRKMCVFIPKRNYSMLDEANSRCIF